MYPAWEPAWQDPGALIQISERVCAQVIHPPRRTQHRLILPRCRSSTISSNISSTPHLFCCANRRRFMHRPKQLSREKLKQVVCRLTLPTIVRFFRLFVTRLLDSHLGITSAEINSIWLVSNTLMSVATSMTSFTATGERGKLMD